MSQKHMIFNETAKNYKDESLKLITRELMRSLFFSRIAQVELSVLGKSEILSDDVRKSIHTVAEAIRRFDMSTRSKLPEDDGAWLTKELGKDKLMDIAQLVEATSRVANSGPNENYEAFFSMLVNFLDKTVHLQVQKSKLDMPKYNALFRFFINELNADVHGYETAVDFNPKADTLTFKMAQPGNTGLVAPHL